MEEAEAARKAAEKEATRTRKAAEEAEAAVMAAEVAEQGHKAYVQQAVSANK